MENTTTYAQKITDYYHNRSETRRKLRAWNQYSPGDPGKCPNCKKPFRTAYIRDEFVELHCGKCPALWAVSHQQLSQNFWNPAAIITNTICGFLIDYDQEHHAWINPHG